MSKLRTALSLLRTPRRMILPMGQNGLLGWIPDKPYLKLVYRCEMGNRLDLKHPITFSEKLQWLKLHDRNPEYSMLVDKYLMKEIVAQRIGQEHVIPLLGVWEKAEDIDFDGLPNQFVIKCNHDSGSVIICRDKASLNIKEVRKKLKAHLAKDAYKPSREWPYKNVKRVIIAEEYLDNGDAGLIDYKLYCFDGIPKYCQVIKDRNTHETIDFYNMEWKLQPFNGLGREPHGEYIQKPDNFDQMISIAKEFAQGTKFVRIDLYNIKGHVYFGEFTLYPKSGLGFFVPLEWNEIMGGFIIL